MPTRLLVALALPLLLLLPRPAAADLLVSSGGTDQVLRYDGTTGAFIDAFVSAGSGGLDQPSGLTFGPDGNLYVTSFSFPPSPFLNHVLRYDGSTGAFLDVFVSAGSGGLDQPFGLTFGPDGNLYVSSVIFARGFITDSQVLRYDGSTGAFLDAFVPADSGGLFFPTGLTFGPDANLYVSSALRNQVLRYDGSTGAFLDAFVSSGSGGLLFPLGLTFGPDGNLYVSSNSTDQVLRYGGTTGAFIDVFASGGGLTFPGGLTFGPDGHLYVSSAGTDQVLRYDGTTGTFIDAFVSANSGGLDLPTFLIFTPEQVGVPEPSSLTLLGLGALGLVGYSWRRRKRAAQ
jgi:hypothetical protein